MAGLIARRTGRAFPVALLVGVLLGAGEIGLRLEEWTQSAISRGDGDHAMKPRRRLIERQWLAGGIGNSSSAFFDQEETGGQVPFIFRFDGECGRDPSCSNQGHRVRD